MSEEKSKERIEIIINDPRNNHGAALLMIANLNRKVADKDSEIELLHSQISDIKSAIISCFRERPIACDGALMVSVEKYNALVCVVNVATSKHVKQDICPNCDSPLPDGCGGIFKDESACRFIGKKQ